MLNYYERVCLFLHKRRTKLIICTELLVILFLLCGWYGKKHNLSISASLNPKNLFKILRQAGSNAEDNTSPDSSGKKKDFIKWVDFTIPSNVMTRAFRYDVETCQQEIHLNWIDLLAYLGARYGGDFSRFTASDLDTLAERIKGGTSIEELTKDMKYFSYYKEIYTAVLGGMVGYYELEIPASEAPAFALADTQINEAEPGISNEPDVKPSDGAQGTEPQVVPEKPESPQKVWVTKYGLKAFHPLAKNFPYSHYDDFGVSRSYGYRRQHLGHDMMGQTGTPIIAVESGYVEAIGWNQYGGWRLGIRSFDKKRYYYYAHLRKNYPYQSNLKEGSLVTAGDVIGYMGRTGYSSNENTNNIDQTHLHFGLQLIFDESQKEGNNEIWIDCYELVKFLSVNRSEAAKVSDTKEWSRIYEMKDPLVGTITQ